MSIFVIITIKRSNTTTKHFSRLKVLKTNYKQHFSRLKVLRTNYKLDIETQ